MAETVAGLLIRRICEVAGATKENPLVSTEERSLSMVCLAYNLIVRFIAVHRSSRRLRLLHLRCRGGGAYGGMEWILK